MSVSTMKKLSLIALRSEADTLMHKLQRLACVELSQLPPEEYRDNALIAPVPVEDECSENERLRAELEATLKFLMKYRSAKSGLFTKKQEIAFERFAKNDGAFEHALEVSSEVSGIITGLAELKADEVRQSEFIESLIPWEKSCIPLEVDGTGTTTLLRGSLPAATDTDALLGSILEVAESCAIEVVSRDANAAYVIVMFHNDSDEDVCAGLARAGFLRCEFKNVTGSADRAINSSKLTLNEISDKRAKLEARAAELAGFTAELEAASDIVETRLAASAEKRKLMCTASTVLLSGYIPEQATPFLEKELCGFSCYYELTEPEEGESVPVLLRNKPIAEPFETVVGLYSMPAYKTFDPTAIMAVFYFIIFGLMLADVVYGLLLAVGGFLAVKLLDLGDGVKKLVRLFAICGISCTVAGVLFGGYMGDLPRVFCENILGRELPPLAVWFDPVENAIMFLVVSLVVGAAHLLCGMGIKFYILCRSGHPIAAIFDIGSWYVLFAGIGVFVINSTVGAVIAIAGALMLILSQGREEKNVIMKLFKGVGSLYNIVSYASDLLSYSRIMALGLASAVIASVINILATLAGPSVFGILLFIVVLPLGHAVNIGINLLGTFVHTSRLQYIEFFGKFYEDGGRPFKPVKAQLKYTKLSAKEKQN